MSKNAKLSLIVVVLGIASAALFISNSSDDATNYVSASEDKRSSENQVLPDQEREVTTDGASRPAPETDGTVSQDQARLDWTGSLSQTSKLDVTEGHRIDIGTPLAEKYDALVSEALKGDPNAAIELAASLSHCLLAPRNTQEFDDLINETNRTRIVEGNAFQVLDLDEATSEIVSQYEYCKGIEKEQVLDHFVYMKIAADNGNLQAKTDLLSYGSMDLGDRAVAYRRVWETDEEMYSEVTRHLIDAADAGNLSAIYRVGELLSDGSGHLTSLEAAAYRIASAEMRIRSGTGRPESIRRRMEEVRNSLSPSDADEVVDLANSILERDNCCFYLKKADN